jgi:hypothetical protein
VQSVNLLTVSCNWTGIRKPDLAKYELGIKVRDVKWDTTVRTGTDCFTYVSARRLIHGDTLHVPLLQSHVELK